LEVQCPHSQKYQAFFASTVLPAGHCIKCRSWLGKSSNRAIDIQIDEETFVWQKWVINTIEELHIAGSYSRTLPWGNFRLGLSRCRQILGGTKQLVLLANVPEISLTRWITGTIFPSLESLLKLCYVLDLTPLQLMTSTSSSLEEAMKVKSTNRLPRPKRPAYQLKKQVNTLEYLQAILDGREEPHSVRWIERHLGLARHTLMNHHPKEAKLVIALYRAHLTERSRLRKEQIDNEVTAATLKLDAQGVFPSELRVSKMLTNPNWMRSAEGLTAWHTARRKLGLEE
jgi:hypothetical protein